MFYGFKPFHMSSTRFQKMPLLHKKASIWKLYLRNSAHLDSWFNQISIFPRSNDQSMNLREGAFWEIIRLKDPLADGQSLFRVLDALPLNKLQWSSGQDNGLPLSRLWVRILDPFLLIFVFQLLYHFCFRKYLFWGFVKFFGILFTLTIPRNPFR